MSTVCPIIGARSWGNAVRACDWSPESHSSPASPWSRRRPLRQDRAGTLGEITIDTSAHDATGGRSGSNGQYGYSGYPGSRGEDGWDPFFCAGSPGSAGGYGDGGGPGGNGTAGEQANSGSDITLD